MIKKSEISFNRETLKAHHFDDGSHLFLKALKVISQIILDPTVYEITGEMRMWRDDPKFLDELWDDFGDKYNKEEFERATFEVSATPVLIRMGECSCREHHVCAKEDYAVYILCCFFKPDEKYSSFHFSIRVAPDEKGGLTCFYQRVVFGF